MTTPRAIGSGTISFGLVSVPFKLYTATSAQQTSFNMLHKKCGSRLKQQYLCPVDSEIVERADTVKGYEYAKDQYVQFTDDELKGLQAGKTDALELVEFVPEDSVDLLVVEKSYYLGPDKGGERAYQLLSRAMREMQVLGVGRYWTRGKVQLVLIRPYKKGLVLHYAFYENEVRDFEGIAPAGEGEFKDIEMDMARRYVDSLTSETFQPGKYKDEYEDRVRAAVDLKIVGKDIAVVAEPPKASIIDIFEALKRSLPPEALSKPAPKPKKSKKGS
jgi:DNA end-binding protein Ku